MIDSIHLQLLAWALWAEHDKVWGTEYPRQSIYCRAYRAGRVWDETWRHEVVPLADWEGLAMDCAVAQLATLLREVVRQMYLRRGSVAEKAKALHLCARTFWWRLHEAHQQLDDCLVQAAPLCPRPLLYPIRP